MLWDLSTYRPETIGIETPFYAGNKEFQHVCHALENYANSIRNYQREHGRRTLQCRLYAWNHMMDASSIVDLKDRIPREIPVVIVAAGPSLHKNAEVLNRLKGHALIICTDRAVGTLDEHGVVPDIITSLDTDKSPKYMEADVTRNSKLLCTYQLNDESQRYFKGRCIYYYGLKHEKILFGDKSDDGNGFDHGGNVAGSTFTLCRVLGIKTIILIGQDLAFLGEKHHADSNDEGVPNIEAKEIPGIDGKPVKSNDMWIKFRDFYERQIAIYPELRVIDATEGGALIRGTEIMPLSQVADEVCQTNYDIEGIFNNLPKVQSYEEYMETVKKLEGWANELDDVARTSKELAEICRKLLKISKFQDITDPKHEKLLQHMDELRKKMFLFETNTLLEDYWIKDMYSIPDRTFVLRSREEAVPVFEDAASYYEHLPEDCKSLKEEILSAIDEGKRDNCK